MIENIRRNWRIMEGKGTLPGRDDLIGVLRTILNSISIWRTQSLHSRSYLHYLEGFSKNSGVSVRKATNDWKPVPDPEPDPLLVIGRTWLDQGDEAAMAEFTDQVEALLETGGTERVINVCQQLMGEHNDMSVVPILSAFALRGHQKLKTEMG